MTRASAAKATFNSYPEPAAFDTMPLLQVTVTMAMTMSPTSADAAKRPRMPTPDRDPAEELDDPAQHGEEGARPEVSDVGEEHGVAVDPGLPERSKEGSGSVIDEDPGQGETHDH